MSRRLAPLRRRLHTEELQVAGERLLAKARELAREGNVRRITVKNPDGRVILEVPLNVGVAGAVLRPSWVAIGAVAALAGRYTLGVERVGVRTAMRD